MKPINVVSVCMTTLVVLATAAHAGDRRSAASSLYGGPKGESNSDEYLSRARLDEALRKGTAGYVGSTTNSSISTTSAGCMVITTITAENAMDSDTTSTAKCQNNGDIKGTTNIGGANSNNRTK